MKKPLYTPLGVLCACRSCFFPVCLCALYVIELKENQKQDKFSEVSFILPDGTQACLTIGRSALFSGLFPVWACKRRPLLKMSSDRRTHHGLNRTIGLFVFLFIHFVSYAQWNGASGSSDYSSLIYRDGNIRTNGLFFGRYGSSIVGDSNPFMIASEPESGEHDLLLFGNSQATLHFRLYDGNLKLGIHTTPNTVLYNNGSAFIGKNLGVGVNGALSQLHIADGLNGEQIRISRGTGAVRFVQVTNKDNLYLYNNDASLVYMFWKEDGHVGIGTSDPKSKLHISGGHLTIDAGTNPAIYTGTGSSDLNRYLSLLNSTGLSSASGLKAGGILVSDSYSYANPGKNDLVVKGSIAVGTNSSAGYKLAVAGKTITEEVVVKLQGSWPDYVFENDFILPSLSEVEQFVLENKHLPDVPTAQSVRDNGVSIGEMNAILLKKVEELTLYMIQMNHENGALKSRVRLLEHKIQDK